MCRFPMPLIFIPLVSPRCMHLPRVPGPVQPQACLSLPPCPCQVHPARTHSADNEAHVSINSGCVHQQQAAAKGEEVLQGEKADKLLPVQLGCVVQPRPGGAAPRWSTTQSPRRAARSGPAHASPPSVNPCRQTESSSRQAPVRNRAGAAQMGCVSTWLSSRAGKQLLHGPHLVRGFPLLGRKPPELLGVSQHQVEVAVKRHEPAPMHAWCGIRLTALAQFSAHAAVPPCTIAPAT